MTTTMEQLERTEKELRSWLRLKVPPEALSKLNVVGLEGAWGPLTLGVIAGRLTKHLQSAGLIVEAMSTEGTAGWPEIKWSTRQAPHMYAVQVRSIVRGIVDLFDKPPIVRIEVLPVQRVVWNNASVRKANEEGRKLARTQTTCVVVRIVCDHYAERALIISAEKEGAEGNG